MVPVILGVPASETPGENRVAIVPPVAAEFVEAGHEVVVAEGAGAGAHWSDTEYTDAGCEILDQETVFERADVLFQVQGFGTEGFGPERYRSGQTVIGLLGPYEVTEDELETLGETDVSAFALELLPRISRAQSMDALSSQSSLAGYQAAIAAAEEHPKMFPMEMTAAGTVRPAEVFVIGAGVAGLKAIATAERLGASTTGYDIRLEVKQEVESLGADFLELDLETAGSGDEEGYAREMDEAFYEEQRHQLEQVVPESDVLITTAAIPGAPAPELVTGDMIAEMDDGSVVIDLSAPTGGNCEPTEAGETVTHGGVTIHGPTNLPAETSRTASQLYANNLQSFFENLQEDGELHFDLEDEIIDSTLLVHDGDVRNPHIDDETESEDTTAAETEEENED